MFVIVWMPVCNPSVTEKVTDTVTDQIIHNCWSCRASAVAAPATIASGSLCPTASAPQSTISHTNRNMVCQTGIERAPLCGRTVKCQLWPAVHTKMSGHATSWWLLSRERDQGAPVALKRRRAGNAPGNRARAEIKLNSIVEKLWRRGPQICSQAFRSGNAHFGQRVDGSLGRRMRASARPALPRQWERIPGARLAPPILYCGFQRAPVRCQG